MPRATGQSAPWCASTAPRSPESWRRRSCSGTRAERSRAPCRRAGDSSQRRTGARSSSTRSASFRWRCSRSCCAPCKRAKSSRSARAAWNESTCASSRVPTAIWRTRRAPAASARTCTTGSPSSSWSCRRCAERFGLQDVRLLPELLDALQRLDWPGNVRQLENAVARTVALSTGGEIGLEAFAAASAAPAADPDAEALPEGTLSLREQLEAVERSLIGRTIAAVGGNQSEAARRLGMNRGSLIERLKKYGLMPG